MLITVKQRKLNEGLTNDTDSVISDLHSLSQVHPCPPSVRWRAEWECCGRVQQRGLDGRFVRLAFTFVKL